MKKILLLYSYLLSELSDMINLFIFKPSWSIIPKNILSRAIQNLNIDKIGFKLISNTNYIYIGTLDGITFIGPTDKREFSCSSFSINRIKRLHNSLFDNSSIEADGQAALLHNIALRYCLEFSSYPYWAFRTSSLRSGDTFVDIGAFRGYVSIKAALLVGQEGSVFSIEPIPRNIDFIKLQKDLNNLHQIEIIEGVFSSQNNQSIKFFRSKNQLNSTVKKHLSASSENLILPNFSIDMLIEKLIIKKSKRVIISLTTNGSEAKLIVPLLNSLKLLKLKYIEIIVPVIYVGNEINNSLKAINLKDFKIINYYPWLKVITKF